MALHIRSVKEKAAKAIHERYRFIIFAGVRRRYLITVRITEKGVMLAARSVGPTRQWSGRFVDGSATRSIKAFSVLVELSIVPGDMRGMVSHFEFKDSA